VDRVHIRTKVIERFHRNLVHDTPPNNPASKATEMLRNRSLRILIPSHFELQNHSVAGIKARYFHTSPNLPKVI
jgi:hypothetical protein